MSTENSDQKLVPVGLDDHNFVQRPALEALLNGELNENRIYAFPRAAIIMLFGMGLLVSLVGYFQPRFFLILSPFGALVMFCSLVWSVRALVKVQRAHSARLAIYLDCCKEVKDLHRQVYSYINNLDERTRKYFHCVTNSKVTNYFILRQVENGLSELIQKLEVHLVGRTISDLMAIEKLLSAPFRYRNGFAFNSGQQFEESLATLRGTVHRVTQELETGIGDLEQEIAVIRSQSDSEENEQPTGE